MNWLNKSVSEAKWYELVAVVVVGLVPAVLICLYKGII